MISSERQTYLASLNTGLKEAMAESDKVVVIGEDIRDPYGGAFKVTRGLSSAFPDRVFNTPISEAAIAGIAMGLALRGFLPVYEIMFGDFLALCADQLLNGTTKFPLMYKGKVSVPAVVRTPMGGGRGYGPTHSQSIEKMFLGMPGLSVIAPSNYHTPGDLLRRAILEESNPALFLEHKMLYPRRLSTGSEQFPVEYVEEESGFPVAVARNYTSGKPDVVVLGYGIVGLHIEALMEEMQKEEIRLMGILPSKIDAPLPEDVLPLIAGCDTVIVAEESSERFNWGSEIACDLYDRLLGKLKRPVIRLGSKNDAIPAAKLAEQEVLLDLMKIRDAIFRGLI